MNIRLGFGCAAALLIAMMFASCTKVEMEAPSAKFGGEIRFGITKNDFSKPATKSALESESKVLVAHDPNDPESFGLSMTVVDGIQTPKSNLPATRGAQITDVNAFDVAAYYFAPDQENGLLYFADQVSDGVNTTGKQYYWPMMGTMNFVATYPSGLIANGIQTIADDNGNLQPFSYTIPEDVTAQQDIMVAVTNGIENAPRSQSGAAVGLNFQHLLAAVQFKVGKMIATRINSLTISGVKGGNVEFIYDPETNKWNCSSSADDVSYSPIYTIGDAPNIDTYGLTEGTFITNNDNRMTMFVMPQELNAAKISVNYTELITGTTHDSEAILSGHSWTAGQTTIYKLDIIAETLQITIPAPPDADAHYVRVDLQYDLSGLANYAGEGITISNVTATTRWENDGSNTASSDKQSIYINTTLTEMQEKEFFTDELWELRYSVDDDGTKTYTVGSANGPARVKENNLGYETLNLNIGSSGPIYLFLDENDGNTDRNGVLELKATVTQNGTSRDVVLGSGKFKQLAPSWNDDGIGVERFEDEGTYPYGFSYNRVVTYTNTTAEWYLNQNWIIQGIYKIFMWLFGLSMDAVLPDSEGMAEGFVSINKENDNYGAEILKSVVLDYGALNTVQEIASDNDGLQNTKVLYDYTGAVDLSELEVEIDKSLGIASDDDWKKDESGNSSNPSDYAAFMALTRNRMRELHTYITSSEGTTMLPSVILHRVGEGGTDGTGDETGAPIIEWYLPSSEEAKSLVETGTGLEATPISPLDGTYWSSTAGVDPASGTNGYAYSYTYSKNTYSTVNPNEDRTVEWKVRAVRKKPTAN